MLCYRRSGKGRKAAPPAMTSECRAAEQGSHSGNGELVKPCGVSLAGVTGLFGLLPLQVVGESWMESSEAR